MFDGVGSDMLVTGVMSSSESMLEMVDSDQRDLGSEGRLLRYVKK